MTSRSRLVALQVLVLALVTTLLGRLWFLQVASAGDYDRAAAANRSRELVVPAARGQVYDARGTALVRARTALVLTVDRGVLQRQRDGGTQLLQRLAAVTGTPAATLRRTITPCGPGVPTPCWRGAPYQPVPVAQYDARVPAQARAALAVDEQREQFPGAAVQFASVRDYPLASSAAHLLGYLGPVTAAELATSRYAGVRADALVGRAGVEATYEGQLRGRDGLQQLTVDRVGAVTGTTNERAPIAGDDLVLSIDEKVQQAAETALAHALQRARTLPSRSGGRLKADSGAIVVLQARTGRVVAMASAPSYDPSVFTGGVSQRQYNALVDDARGAPLLSRAVQGAYAPASTFKVVSAAAAVGTGDYPLSGSYDCPSVFPPTGQRNFDSEALGTVELRQAIIKSCDTIFYRFGYEQWLRDGGNRPVAKPADAMLTMAKAFGLGSPTGVDLPDERSGLIADRAAKRRLWTATKGEACTGAANAALPALRRQADQEFCDDGYRLRGGDATNFTIGQGDTLVTPLQLAVVYAAVANGGALLEPHVARALISPGGTVHEIRPVVRRRVPVDPAVLGYLRAALSGVTQPGGTASAAFAGSPVAVAGKTGTGEVAGKQDTSWFASFAPAADPDLVVVGMVSQGGVGGTVAAPMVREVYDAIYGGAVGPRPTGLPTRRPDGTLASPAGSR